MLDRILRVASNVLDLTSDDTGDPRRMIEIDAVVFVVTGGPDSKSEGFNFLSLIDLNFNYFASDHNRAGTGFSAPGAIGAVSGLSQQGWMFAAAADYSVEIANASSQRVTVLARPHLTTVSGTPASFHAGGEIVFQVSGMNTGDIKPFPFGTSLKVTPTLLRTPAADGSPRVHIAIEAGRSSVLSLLGADSDLPVTVDKILTTSQAVVDMGHTLILSGFSQKQTQTKRSGVPGLMSVPILKYFFSTKSTVVTNSAVVILLTPRDPVFWGAEYNKSFTEFVQRRRDFLRAMQGTEQDLKSFRERYPDWDQLPPSRLSTHAILMENSVFYRNESGQNLTTTPLDLRVLSEEPETK
jgi:general secretion pathway protein D